VEALVGALEIDEVVRRDDVGERFAEDRRRLVRPAARDVANRLPSAAEHERREAEGADEAHALRVAAEREVEDAEAVARERVCPALEDDGARAVNLHDLPDDRLEDALLAHVVDAVVEGEVDGVVLPRARADVAERARPGEKVAELVKRDAHDAVRREEGLLDAVAVVDVDVDLEHARVVLEELEDAEDDVIDVAEAGGFRLLRVVQAARPVDRDVSLPVVEARRAVDRRARLRLAEAKEAVKDGAVRKLAAVDCARTRGRGGGGGGDGGSMWEAARQIEMRRE
jgi:hypothetical protein